MLLATLLLSLAQASAQAPAAIPSSAAAPAPAPSSRYRGRIFISPMGEPFRPSSREDDTLIDWFRQADRNHDGQLTVDEMQQDAERFFELLDVNHDGEIDPDEITRYETVVAPEIQSGSSFAMMDMAGESQGGGREGGHGKHHRGGGIFHSNDSDPHQGAGKFGLLDLPEPVVSADFNFNRGVSLAEFRQAAGQRFLALDVDHKGLVTLAGLVALRPAPPAAPNKPQRSGPDESALPSESN
jgi:hypothetical protein